MSATRPTLTADRKVQALMAGDVSINEALGLDHSKAPKLVRLAASMFREKKYGDAALLAELATLGDPKMFRAWALRGASLAKDKKAHEAIPCLLQALSLRPDDVASWTDLGELYLQLLDYDKATEALKQAMTLDKDAKHPAGRRARAVAGRAMALLKKR